MLALRSGWHRDQVEAILAGRDLGEEKIDALIGVVREAAANSGHVSDLAWARAAGSGWSDEQLAEAFAYLGLTVFTSYFLNYAGTELDIPAGAPGSGPADADPADVGPSYGGTARFAAALPTCRSSARSSWWPASAPSWFRASAHASP